MTSHFRDRFNRADGAIGSNFTIACGNATIFDEAVLPVTDGSGNSGLSPQLEGVTDEKTQVLYTAEGLDSRDYVVRMVWSHDPEILGERPLSQLPSLVSTDPAMTALTRMTKDPMLVDLGRAQDPSCFDQGYGVRVTCPRTGALPVLKLVKYMPPAVPPGIARPTSTEPDGAVVLASVTLQAANLIVDPDDDGTGNPLYRGFFQETRLRIRFSDERVQLDVFHNDRNMNTPVLEYTDQEDPSWGDVGLPGFEFLSPRLNSQTGNSPFQFAALPIMRCHLFEVSTIKAVRRPVSVTPQNFWTYDRVTDRVILLVEKNGDGRYTATGSGTKRDTYLQFVVEAESHIVREVGYFDWARRSANVHLADARDTYELPENVGLLNLIRPSWDAVPLEEILDWIFHQRLAGVQKATSGRPRIYRQIEPSVNDRPQIEVFPVPSVSTEQGTADDFMIVEYFARPVYPSEPDLEIPMVPQHHMDVLIYGATTHALLIDQDASNAQLFAATFKSKLQGLKRDAHRKVSTRDSKMRSAGDVRRPGIRQRGLPLRAATLEGFDL